MTTKILYDSDIGSDIDDTVCLAYLLANPMVVFSLRAVFVQAPGSACPLREEKLRPASARRARLRSQAHPWVFHPEDARWRSAFSTFHLWRDKNQLESFHCWKCSWI